MKSSPEIHNRINAAEKKTTAPFNKTKWRHLTASDFWEIFVILQTSVNKLYTLSWMNIKACYTTRFVVYNCHSGIWKLSSDTRFLLIPWWRIWNPITYTKVRILYDKPYRVDTSEHEEASKGARDLLSGQMVEKIYSSIIQSLRNNSCSVLRNI